MLSQDAVEIVKLAQDVYYNAFSILLGVIAIFVAIGLFILGYIVPKKQKEDYAEDIKKQDERFKKLIDKQKENIQVVEEKLTTFFNRKVATLTSELSSTTHRAGDISGHLVLSIKAAGRLMLISDWLRAEGELSSVLYWLAPEPKLFISAYDKDRMLAGCKEILTEYRNKPEAAECLKLAEQIKTEVQKLKPKGGSGYKNQ